MESQGQISLYPR